MNTIFVLLTIASLWEPPLQSSRMEATYTSVEYQRSLSLPKPEVNLILSPHSDHYTQGECPGWGLISQGKSHEGLLSGRGLPRGKNKHPLEDVVTLMKHGWEGTDKDMLFSRILELNNKLSNVGFVYVNELMRVLVNDSLHLFGTTFCYVDGPTLTFQTVTTIICVDVTANCNISQARLDSSECPKMRSFTSNDLQPNCDTFLKLPFNYCELLSNFNRSDFNGNYLCYYCHDLKLLFKLNLSNVGEVNSTLKRSYPSRSLLAVQRKYTLTVTFVAKNSMSPISQGDIVTQVALYTNDMNMLSSTAIVPDTNIDVNMCQWMTNVVF